MDLRYPITIVVIGIFILWLTRHPSDWRPWGIWGWPAGSSYRNALIVIAVGAIIVNAFAWWFSSQP